MKRQSILLLVFGFMTACGPTGDREKENTSQEARAELAMSKTAEQRLQEIRSEVKTLKADLIEKGEYNCCIQPSCDWCLLHEGECECYANLKAGKDVCPGCGLGWHNGNGVVEGMSADDVKWNITHEHGDGGHQH